MFQFQHNILIFRCQRSILLQKKTNINSWTFCFRKKILFFMPLFILENEPIEISILFRKPNESRVLTIKQSWHTNKPKRIYKKPNKSRT